MILKPGDKVLIVHRRLFDRDGNRFFAGAVEEYDAGLVKVTGFTFFQDMGTGHVEKKDDQRTKIIAIGSGTVLVYLLRGDVQIEKLHFVHAGSKTTLTDGGAFQMDLTEH